MKKYDTFIMGHISKDKNVFQGKTVNEIGGAVVYASCSAHAIGYKTGVLTKLSFKDRKHLEIFSVPKKNIIALDSENSISIKNIYHSEDRERRTCTALSIAEPFKIGDVPDNIDSRIFHFADLISGEFDSEMIKLLSDREKIALDVQGFLRFVGKKNEMIFRDWRKKKNTFPI